MIATCLGTSSVVHEFVLEMIIKPQGKTFEDIFLGSSAREELLRRCSSQENGEEVIKCILQHLEVFPPEEDVLKLAFGRLCYDIKTKMGMQGVPLDPDFNDIQGWIAWLKEHAK